MLSWLDSIQKFEQLLQQWIEEYLENEEGVVDEDSEAERNFEETFLFNDYN